MSFLKIVQPSYQSTGPMIMRSTSWMESSLHMDLSIAYQKQSLQC